VSTFSDLQSSAVHELDGLTPELSEFHLGIWGFAESAWREYRSCAAYVDRLRAEGFEVEAGSGQMPTAFHAVWGDSGPQIGMYAEYDAVPGYSQAPVPYRQPREGMHPWAPGHTDAHSALGTAALSAAIATKRALEKSGTRARLHLWGEPAEKVCGSKPVHATKGYYDELDAAISYHPLWQNTAILDITNCLYWSVVFTFECTEPEPWVSGAADPSVGSHNDVRSPGALDAVALMITATKYTKENMYPRTGSWSLNEALLPSGQATSDNLPPRFAQIQYSWRSPLIEIQQQVVEILQRNARHAAGLANCIVSMRWITKTRPGLPNHAMTDVLYRNLSIVGPPVFGQEVLEFAKQLAPAAGVEVEHEPFQPANLALTTPQQHDAEQRANMPPWQQCTGADDYTEYTWHCPTVRFYTAKPFLRGLGNQLWHWANNAMNGLPAAIDPTWTGGGKTIAATAVELIENPGLIAAATREFEERRGRDENAKFAEPLLPRDFAPPVDLPWPEYINTPRGFEWQLPTTRNFGDQL
jgi:aminobenzoyl-glutamate utilization protein B